MTNTSKYARLLKQRAPISAVPAGMTREKCTASIEGITAQLKGPLPDAERVMLCHDRADLRDILALIEQVQS